MAPDTVPAPEPRSGWWSRLRHLVSMVVLAIPLLGLAPLPAVDLVTDVCAGLVTVELLDGTKLCTHGDDTAFAAGPKAEPTRASGRVPGKRPTCIGNGRSGHRVQILYVHAGQRELGDRFRRPIRRWARQVEWTFGASAAAEGGQRAVRWLTKRPNDGRCAMRVRPVQMSPHELDDFGRMVSRLRALGFSRGDRKYLVFAESDRYCGIADAPRDARPDRHNSTNQRAGYARVDRPCWRSGDQGVGSVAAHELMHTLGSVHNGAPNASGYAHCTDEYDLMCYRDHAGARVSQRCRDGRSDTSGAGDHHNWLFDCGGDDYFSVSPRPGSYLDRHWNTANSPYLAPWSR